MYKENLYKNHKNYCKRQTTKRIPLRNPVSDGTVRLDLGFEEYMRLKNMLVVTMVLFVIFCIK